MDGQLNDWKLIPDWDEAIAARPHELGHFNDTTKKPTTSYSEAWRYWIANDVTQRSEAEAVWLAQHRSCLHRKPRGGITNTGWADDDI